MLTKLDCNNLIAVLNQAQITGEMAETFAELKAKLAKMRDAADDEGDGDGE